jgi:hypothetical protein
MPNVSKSVISRRREEPIIVGNCPIDACNSPTSRYFGGVHRGLLLKPRNTISSGCERSGVVQRRRRDVFLMAKKDVDVAGVTRPIPV